MKVFAMITMSKTTTRNVPPNATQFQDRMYKSEVIDYPGEQSVARQRVLLDMIASIPAELQDGVVLFFSAEPEEIKASA